LGDPMNIQVDAKISKALNRTYFICLSIGILFFSACQNDHSATHDLNGDPETGSFACALNWPDSTFSEGDNLPNSRALDCAAAEIDSITFTFYDEDDELLTGYFLDNPVEFNCEAHSARVNGIPPGSGYSVEITAKHVSDITMYQGVYSNFSIVAGVTTSPPGGEIDMERIMLDLYAEHTNSFGMTFNLILPGTFTMGSPSDELYRDDNETEHEVTLTTRFYMQTTEVTQGQWEAIMGSNPSTFTSCGSDCPVENVSWEDVQTFLTALNSMGEGTYRLPTEAEWEYAARAGSTSAFANGDITAEQCTYDSNLDAMGWYCYNGSSTTHPVALKDANAWGLYDMHGNVYEWVQDWYGTYPTDLVTDPTGPASGTDRVLRSGSYNYYARYCRSANRNTHSPDYSYSSGGFRLVLDLGQMALILAGCFDMGDAFNEWNNNELPVHNVCITSGFYMDLHEVTNAEYAACVSSGSCAAPQSSSSYTRSSYYGNPAYDDFPVIRVDWDQANDYCTWAGKRLPTEAEWEYAARGGLAGMRYPWGDTISGTDANYLDSGDSWDNDTSPVEYYAPNGYGLYDMAGNVWEWVHDWYQDDYYDVSPTNDPPGPTSGTYHVLRGGCWYDDVTSLRVARRAWPSASPSSVIGFRCAGD